MYFKPFYHYYLVNYPKSRSNKVTLTLTYRFQDIFGSLVSFNNNNGSSALAPVNAFLNRPYSLFCEAIVVAGPRKDLPTM